MNSEKTHLYTVDEFDSILVKETIKEVYNILKERGYNPIYQLVGYLTSGDPGYISSYKDARKKILRIDRTSILEEILKGYLKP